MIRYTLVVLAILGTAATAIAASGPHYPAAPAASHGAANVTVAYKDSPFPVVGPIVMEQCAVEDCSDAAN